MLGRIADEGGGHLNSKDKDAKAFAKQFQNELKLNEALRKEYEQEGKSYDRQRQFKAKWAALKVSELRQQRIKKETSCSLTEIDGEYCTFGRIVFREGNDPPAYRTASTYVASAISLWQAGKQDLRRTPMGQV